MKPIQPAQIPDSLLAGVLTFGMALVVGSALGFEHIGGYIPCALCLMQRNPYYIGLGLGFLTLLATLTNRPVWLVRALFLLLAAVMLTGMGLGIYHAGVEWQFWQGPASCSVGATGGETPVNVLEALNSTKAPSCTVATLRVLGLSFAGWNVLTSAALAALALWAGLRRKPA